MEINTMRGSAWRVVTRWFDNEHALIDTRQDGIDWLRMAPFIALHVACFAVLWVGVSTTAVTIAIALYAARMFAITGFYHRYFSHRAFHTSRPVQFAFAFLAATSAQRGPLWWASHHRHHHSNSDKPGDSHSALQHGFLQSHMGWFMGRENFAARDNLIKDYSRFPELRFLDRYDALPPLALGVMLYIVGAALAHFAPQLNVTGAQLLVWGLCISTVVLYHATFTINSLAHCWGRRRYNTRDNSRNNLWLALITFGEGWHNNHHRYPGAARQGFRWWEIDLTYYGLRVLSALGLIWNLRPVPARLQASSQIESQPRSI